jgi:glycosyltransferase involved in cell wall biosynthesis
MKVIFFLTWPVEDASSRYRVYQFEKKLIEKNITLKYDVLFPNWFLRIKNRKGIAFSLLKVFCMIYYLIIRIIRIPMSIRYDVVFVHREVFPFFTPFFERITKLLSKKMIFDFDDAIFLKPTKWSNWRDVLRNPERIKDVCRLADGVITGNQFLSDYAVQFNDNVVIIPTVYNAIPAEYAIKNQIPVIGWIGSWSTTLNLEIVSDALTLLSNKYKFIFRVVGAKNIYEIIYKNVQIEYLDWTLEKENEYLNSFDIGIMPLYDNPWEKGKCAFKLIQYMSCAKPVVASPVGTNKEIIYHGKSGFFASTKEDWIQYLGVLLDNRKMREEMGQTGKQFILDNYSFEKTSEKFINAIVA